MKYYYLFEQVSKLAEGLLIVPILMVLSEINLTCYTSIMISHKFSFHSSRQFKQPYLPTLTTNQRCSPKLNMSDSGPTTKQLTKQNIHRFSCFPNISFVRIMPVTAIRFNPENRQFAHLNMSETSQLILREVKFQLESYDMFLEL